MKISRIGSDIECSVDPNSLLDLGVIPLINENDTVATDEIRFGATILYQHQRI